VKIKISQDKFLVFDSSEIQQVRKVKFWIETHITYWQSSCFVHACTQFLLTTSFFARYQFIIHYAASPG